MKSNRKVILYIAMSLDGFIATNDNDLGFLSIVEQEGQDYGYSEFIKSVDTVIIGRKTYEKVISMGIDFPHADKNVYVITRTSRPDIGSLRFYTGKLSALVTTLKGLDGKNIYCDGGSEIVNELLKEKLIDEFILSIIPIILGDGIKLFTGQNPWQELKLVSSKQFTKGLVQLHYKKVED